MQRESKTSACAGACLRLPLVHPNRRAQTGAAASGAIAANAAGIAKSIFPGAKFKRDKIERFILAAHEQAGNRKTAVSPEGFDRVRTVGLLANVATAITS